MGVEKEGRYVVGGMREREVYVYYIDPQITQNYKDGNYLHIVS